MTGTLLLALLGGALLSYHGGLHAWQAPVAAAALLGALWSSRRALPAWAGLDAWERLLMCGLALLLPGCLLGFRPQFSLNAWSALAALLGLVVALRRSPRPILVPVLAWLAGLGLLYSGLFLGFGFLAAGSVGAEQRFGPVVLPHVAARLFQPNQNILAGAFAVPALLLAVALWARYPWQQRSLAAALAALVAASAVVYAGSRGVYLAALGGLAWLALRWPAPRGKALLRLGAVAALILVAGWKAPISFLAQRVSTPMEGRSLSDSNNMRRMDFWRGSLKLSLERPWLGHGLAAYEAAALRLDLPTALNARQPIARYRLHLEHAHNEWLELAVEAGWPAALALAFFAAAWLWRRWRSGPQTPAVLGAEAMVAAALVLSLTDMNLRTPAVLWALAVTFAALEPLPGDGREGSRSQLWLLFAILCLACATGWAQRQGLHRDRSAGLELSRRSMGAALLLQPLDSELASWALDRTGLRWPLAPWAGRRDPAWQMSQAAMAGGQGDVEGGLAATQRAIQLRPYHAPFHLLYARRLESAGRLEEARAEVEEALRLEPNFSQALAWKIERAPREDQGPLFRRLLEVQKLKVSIDLMDPYTGSIQAIDQEWLNGMSRKLGLSTVF